jgi:hypothetical protein
MQTGQDAMPVQNMLLGCTFLVITVQVLDCHLEQVWGRISFFVSLILLDLMLISSPSILKSFRTNWFVPLFVLKSIGIIWFLFFFVPEKLWNTNFLFLFIPEKLGTSLLAPETFWN